MFGDTRDLTDDEIVATLSRTILPTIVIEGVGDIFLFRRIQENIGASHISLFPIGGRSRVIFAYRNRPQGSPGIPILFFSDQDEWLFGAVPSELVDDDFFHTEGYSVENDLLRDANAIGLMTAHERQTYYTERDLFARWFAIQIARFMRGQPANLAKFAGQVLDNRLEYEGDCQLEDGEEEPVAIRQTILADAEKFIRGKSLMHLMLRQLSRPGRQARHRSEALLEFGAQRDGALMVRVKNWVAGRLEACA